MSDKKTFAAQQHTGGFIPGEVKVAVTIRLLTGGSYLNLVPLFGMVRSHIYKTFDQVIEWVNIAFEMPLVSILCKKQWSVLHEMTQEFAEKSGGFFYGTFGALDGMALQIQCPTLKDMPDPGNFCCRKGFYALNLQAICDKNKRFLWALIMNKGSLHDSAAFAASKLLDLLKEKAHHLKQEGLFLNGDSPHPLHSFLQVPCDQVEVQGDPVGARDALFIITRPIESGLNALLESLSCDGGHSGERCSLTAFSKADGSFMQPCYCTILS